MCDISQLVFMVRRLMGRGPLLYQRGTMTYVAYQIGGEGTSEG